MNPHLGFQLVQGDYWAFKSQWRLFYIILADDTASQEVALWGKGRVVMRSRRWLPTHERTQIKERLIFINQIGHHSDKGVTSTPDQLGTWPSVASYSLSSLWLIMTFLNQTYKLPICLVDILIGITMIWQGMFMGGHFYNIWCGYVHYQENIIECYFFSCFCENMRESSMKIRKNQRSTEYTSMTPLLNCNNNKKCQTYIP